MTPYEYVMVDVFSEAPLAGNQLAVFRRGADVPDELLQPLALEIGFSETVYCYGPGGDGDGDARVRIFTPMDEIPFAGHPVLGTAAVLGGGRGTVRLETGVGTVEVRFDDGGPTRTFGWMSQPLPSVEPVPDPAPILDALGLSASKLPVERYHNGITHLFVALDDEAAVAALTPELGRLARVLPDACVSCFAGTGTRWTTRMFAPGLGVPEDPATGSAAGPLAVHLGRHGLVPFGTEVLVSQGAALRRPSTLHARADGSVDRLERVEVGGSVIVVGRGEFALPS